MDRVGAGFSRHLYGALFLRVHSARSHLLNGLKRRAFSQGLFKCEDGDTAHCAGRHVSLDIDSVVLDASSDSPIWVSSNAQMDSRSLAADRVQAGPTATNLPILSIRCSGLPNLSDQ